MKGFVFKICCTILYCFLIYFYWGFGDSINYFKNALFVKQLIHQGSENFSVLFKDANYLKDTYSMEGTSTEAGWFLERIALLLSYLSFSRFVITSMLFATIAYSGMFKMFESFAFVMPKWDKQLAFVVLFFPTVSIYGSGILKDTLCIAAMGWLFYCSNQLLLKKVFKIKYLVIMAICITLVYQIKIYIVAAFLVPYLIYLIMLLARKIKNIFLRRLFFPLLLLLLFGIYTLNAAKIDTLLGSYAIEKLLDNVKDQQQSYLNAEDAGTGATFDIGTIEPTLSGFVKKMPQGIVATLFRPFIWESKNVLMIFSALESLLILLITLIVILKAGFFKFIRTIFSDPFVFLCVFYALIFAALVGLSTSNFGTLGRYRIPIVPFYLTGILAVLYKAKFTDPKKQHEKTV